MIHINFKHRFDKIVITFDEVHCLQDTDKAILCLIDDKEYWIPLSQVDSNSEVFQKDDFGDLIITEWIAKEKKLI